MALTTTDLTHGVDFTGINPATGGDHNNLVDLAVPKDDGGQQGKGFVLVTKDSALDTPVVPDANTTTKWRRYIWIRIPHATATSQLVTIYAWSQGLAVADPTFSKWGPVIIDVTSIQSQIDAVVIVANNALTTANTANNAANAANNVANTAFNLATDAENKVAVLTTELHGTFRDQIIALQLPVASLQLYTSTERARYARFEELQGSGVDAGASVIGSNVRILNNVSDNTGGLFTLDTVTGIVTILQTGVYYLAAHGVCFTNSHQLNVKTGAGTPIALGDPIYNTLALNTVSRAFGLYVATVANTTIKLDHYVNANLAANGLGKGIGSGQFQIYSRLEIWKIG